MISTIAIIDICGSVTDAAAAEKRPRKEVFHRANQDQYRLSLRASFSRPICMPEEAAKEGGGGMGVGRVLDDAPLTKPCCPMVAKMAVWERQDASDAVYGSTSYGR